MKKIIPLTFDPIFTGIFNDEKNIDIIENFLSIYFNMPIEDIKGNVSIKSRDIISKGKNTMNSQVDLLLKLNDKIINVELNNKLNEGRIDRNIIYACKVHSTQLHTGDGGYNNIGSTVQINLNNFVCNDKELVDSYYFKNEKGKTLSKKFRIDYVDIEKAKKMQYNDTDEKLAKWLRAITAITLDGLERELGGIMDENLKNKLVDEVEKYNEDDDVIALYSIYTKEELERNTDLYYETKEAREKGLAEGRTEGLAEGRAEGRAEIINAMLNNDMDINTVSKITGLTIDEIEKLR